MGIVDDAYVNFTLCGRDVSPLHMLAPDALPGGRIISDAFSAVVKSMASARYSQSDRGARRAAVGAQQLAAFRFVAREGSKVGCAVTVEGDKVKLTMESTDEMKAVLGNDVKTSGTYGVGTRFTLLPPYMVVMQPSTGKAWIKCEPEVVHLPSGLNMTGPTDVYADGFMDLEEINA